MDLKLINDKGESTASVAASDELFAREFNEALIHQVVTAYQANARQGTRAQKGRSAVAKSTRKPWRQKGTGRARAGMASSPLWRGGGRIFPNLPDENFSHKLNKKMYRAGMCSIFSQLAREGRLSQLSIDIVDRPGQLARVATLLGEAGANIVEVSHQRTFSDLPAKGTLLEVVIETRDRAHLDATVASLRAAGFEVEVHTTPGGNNT